jgi:DNA replication protein DnaC
MRGGRSAICQQSVTSTAEPTASIWRPGSTGTGRSHLAIAIARACIRGGARGRFYTVVDLVSKDVTAASGDGAAGGSLVGQLLTETAAVELAVMEQVDEHQDHA